VILNLCRSLGSLLLFWQSCHIRLLGWARLHLHSHILQGLWFEFYCFCLQGFTTLVCCSTNQKLSQSKFQKNLMRTSLQVSCIYLPQDHTNLTQYTPKLPTLYEFCLTQSVHKQRKSRFHYEKVDQATVEQNADTILQLYSQIQTHYQIHGRDSQWILLYHPLWTLVPRPWWLDLQLRHSQFSPLWPLFQR